MEVSEIEKIEKLKYNELVQYLKEKYGNVPENFFLTPTCSSRNYKISRFPEGLYVHHIKENEYGDLTKKEYATQLPYSYQEAVNLVYCNVIEHLLLHIAISKEYFEERYKTLFLGEPICVGITVLTCYILGIIIDYIDGYQFRDRKVFNALKVLDRCKEKVCRIIYDFNKECVVDVNNRYPNLRKTIQGWHGERYSLLDIRNSGRGKFQQIIDEFVKPEITFSSFEEVKKMVDATDEIPSFGFLLPRDYNRNGNRFAFTLNYVISDEAKGWQLVENQVNLTDETLEKADKYLEDKFKPFAFPSGDEILIKKNAVVKYKRNGKSENGYKKYVSSIDGIKLGKYFLMEIETDEEDDDRIIQMMALDSILGEKIDKK